MGPANDSTKAVPGTAGARRNSPCQFFPAAI